MLCGTRSWLCFVQLAARAAAEFARRDAHRPSTTSALTHTNAPSSCTTTTTDASRAQEEEEDSSAASVRLWIDDTAAAAEAAAAHVSSPEYKELHRPALTTSAMGLFGGEPGFEKAHRVWVDPDRPHMKHIYNQTELAKNLRYTRYGYFKRDMQLLDIDKLVRHARMLPTPNRLLTDFLYQRVPLPDHSCAALLRYQRDQMTMLEPWRRDAALTCAEEMFERMVVTNIPPVEVGAAAHAEMIRCCALCANWHKGWEVYVTRARELASPPKGASSVGSSCAPRESCQDEENENVERSETRHAQGCHDCESADAATSTWATRAHPINTDVCAKLVEEDAHAEWVGGEGDGGLVMTTELYDAVLQLCVACGRCEEGLAVLAQAMKEHLRPRATMLDQTLLLLARAGEAATLPHAERIRSLDTVHDAYDNESEVYTNENEIVTSDEYEKGSHRENVDPDHEERVAAARQRSLCAKRGTDVWSLYDFYHLTRTTVSVECYLRMCALCLPPTQAPSVTLQTIQVADASGIRLSLTCYHWLVYSVRVVPDFGDYVVDMFTQLRARGLTPDHIFYTLCFMYCAVQKDGELAMTVYTQFFDDHGGGTAPSRANALSCVGGVNPTPEMTRLFLQACARCAQPRLAMLTRCAAMMDRLEALGSVRDEWTALYETLLQLAGRLGAVESGYSRIKRLVGLGKPLTTAMLNALLRAHAQAGASSSLTMLAASASSLTRELVQFFTLLSVPPNMDTLTALTRCMQRYGACAELERWCEEVRADCVRRGGDEERTVMQTPPHRLRAMRVEWHVRPRDVMLRRFGQHVKPRRPEPVGSMVGSVVPFGRSPGERAV